MASIKGLREGWLETAVTKLRPFFSSHGFEIPHNLRVSCGWPSVGGLAGRHRRIGEAWCSKSSADKHFEIFISPTQSDGDRVLGVLVHELVHCTVGLQCGHKGAFAVCARTLGLEGKMTATVPGDALAERLKALTATLGAYPHGSLSKMTNGRKKQGTRLIKVYCDGCGYTLRGTMSWLLIGVPVCPNVDCMSHGEAMHVDGLDAPED